jgi:pyruvate/2-oxoglutarate dehydrogenase complex dihydrolipoamide dehydrogenase (E3) component
MNESFDVVVLGAGSTGTNVAWYARDNGLSVAIVEAERVGGECSYWACMPSKALLVPLHALAAARRLPGAAQAASGQLDVEAVLSRRDDFVSHLDDGPQVAWVASVGAELVRGQGRIVGDRPVQVTAADGSTRRLDARRAVVVATGTRAALPPARAWRRSRPGTTGRSRPPSRSPGGCSCWVAASSAWRWRRRTAASAPPR